MRQAKRLKRAKWVRVKNPAPGCQGRAFFFKGIRAEAYIINWSWNKSKEKINICRNRSWFLNLIAANVQILLRLRKIILWSPASTPDPEFQSFSSPSSSSETTHPKHPTHNSNQNLRKKNSLVKWFGVASFFFRAGANFEDLNQSRS